MLVLAPAKRGGCWHVCMGLSWLGWPCVCSLVIVNQVLVRFWARRTPRVALGLVCACHMLGSGVVWRGPWFGWHGCLTQAVALRDVMTECRLGCSGQERFMCVLSMMDM